MAVDDEGNPIDALNGTLSVNWTDEFDNLPSFSTPVELKSSSSTKKINYKYLGLYEYNTFTWVDEKDVMRVRPKSLKVTLLANGEPVENVSTMDLSGSTTSTRFPSEWQYLPQLDADGKPIHYSLQFDELPAYYELTFAEKPTFDETNGYTTSNSVSVYENPTFTLKTQTAKATVYWEGDVGTETEMKNRPQSVLLTLMTSKDGGETWEEFWGKSCYSVTAGAEPNEWTYEWNSLPAVDEEGNPLLYKVTQNELAIYTTTVDDPVVTNDENGVPHTEFTVHNSYNDNWNYYVDMAWIVTDPAEKYAIEKVTIETSALTAQYYLTIGTQKPYEPGQLEVRIPYELFDARTGNKGTVIYDVSVGDEKNPSTAYNFTYRIDTHGTADTSDDEIVFYNHRPLSASDNTTITVEYRIDPTKVVDCSTGVLQATATGKYVGQEGKEELKPPAISYRLDTGLKQSGTYKSLYERMYYWDTTYYGTQPDGFDPTCYNYVCYHIYTRIDGNQPTKIEFTDIPRDGGEVIMVRSGYSNVPNGSSSSTVAFTTNTDGSVTWSREWTPSLNSYYMYYDFYVVVRYLRETQNVDGEIKTIYHNDASVSATATDKHENDKVENYDFNDVSVQTDAVQVEWKDYVFTYTGEIVYAYKSLYSFPNAGVTQLEYGKDLSTSYTFTMTVNGYNFANGYDIDMYDDAMYAYATIDGANTDYERLTEKDFELTGKPIITISCSAVDRTNGQTITGFVPDEPFTVWGRKSVDGAWEELGTITMTSASQKDYTLNNDLTGKGYIALRVTSPKGLKDYFYVNAKMGLKLKASSPLVQKWLTQGTVSYIRVDNFAGY